MNRTSIFSALFWSLSVVLIGAMLSGITGCGRSPQGTGSSLPLVVCTTGMVADAARMIGGDEIQVAQLMGEGVDPHLYKATPGDVSLLTKADLVLYSGLHLEGRLAETLSKLKGRPVVGSAEAIKAEQLRHPSEFEGHPDPHVWFDVELWRQAVAAAHVALRELVPESAAMFDTRFKALDADLAKLHEDIKEAMSQIPEQNRVLVTAHDAFGYFGSAYGLEVRAIQGISTESEAGLRNVNELVEFLVTRKIPSVFVETSVPPKTIQSLRESARSRGHELALGGELFSDALGKEGTAQATYIGMMRSNAQTIAKALGSSAPMPWADSTIKGPQ